MTEDFAARVRRLTPSLTPSAARVASYLDRNRATVLASSAAQIAAQLGTSDATGIRAGAFVDGLDAQILDVLLAQGGAHIALVACQRLGDGAVDIHKGEGKSRTTLASLFSGQLFGEMSLYDGSPRSATATRRWGCAAPTP